jgi:hypothetical protein
MFVFSFIGCDKDVINNENGDIINNGNENSNNNGNDTTNKTPNNENDVVNDQMHLLKGTIWYADSGSFFIEFPDNHLNQILFRRYQNFGNFNEKLNGNVTDGTFRLSSYDGETMKLLDYDKSEVSFTVIISENKMTVDRLNAIKWTAPPLRERDFRSYNRTYTKGE